MGTRTDNNSGNDGKKPSFSHIRLLHLEDNEADAMSVKRALDRYMPDVNLVRAHTVEEAEELLGPDKPPYNVILLDLGLPDSSDGHETFHRIEDVAKGVPIVVLTGFDDHNLVLDCADYGAQNYVRKSVISTEPKVLFEAIDFSMHHHKAHQGQLAEKENIIQWVTGSYSVNK